MIITHMEMSPHAMIRTGKHPDTLLLRGPTKVEHRTQEILGKIPGWTQGTLQVETLLVWILERCSSSHKAMVIPQRQILALGMLMHHPHPYQAEEWSPIHHRGLLSTTLTGMNLFEMFVQRCETTVAGGDEFHRRLWLDLSRLATHGPCGSLFSTVSFHHTS